MLPSSNFPPGSATHSANFVKFPSIPAFHYPDLRIYSSTTYTKHAVIWIPYGTLIFFRALSRQSRAALASAAPAGLSHSQPATNNCLVTFIRDLRHRGAHSSCASLVLAEGVEGEVCLRPALLCVCSRPTRNFHRFLPPTPPYHYRQPRSPLATRNAQFAPRLPANSPGYLELTR
jgi:hypothetical protein